MGKKSKNTSKRIKTSHKHSLIKRKTAKTKVDSAITNINKFITQSLSKKPASEEPQKIEA